MGQMTAGSSVVASFATGTLNASGTPTVTSIGGFAGLISGAPGGLSVVQCYSWSAISVATDSAPEARVGGFVGTVEGTAGIYSCIVYATLSSLTNVTAGLLIGGAKNGALNGTSVSPVVVQHTVAYVAPGGEIRDVRLVGGSLRVDLTSSYCGRYPSTGGCTPLKTLNAKRLLKSFNFTDTFQLNPSLANGSLAFQILPMPLSGSAPGSPKIVLPTSPQAVHWLLSTWIARPDILQDFPYLVGIDYDRYCGWYIGCHGVGTSPLGAACCVGWSSPPRNATALADNLHRCSVFACSSSRDCRNGGACSQGICACKEGYAGPDCSERRVGY